MATHSSVLAWRIPGTGEPGGLLSMGSHRVGHDWSDACMHSPLQELGNTCQKNSISSINVQTDLSYTTPQFMPTAQWASPDSSVSSCSQTDLTFGFQVSLPISVQTQTFLPSSKVTSSITAQTDAFIDASFQPGGISRETETSGMQRPADGQVQMDQAVMCGDIFESVHSSYGMSTDNIIRSSLEAETVTHAWLVTSEPP